MIPKPDFKTAINKSFSEISGDLRDMDPDGKNVLDAMSMKNQINSELKEEGSKKEFKFLEFLKDKKNILDVKEILGKGKKTSIWRKRTEIKKFLKDDNKLDDFLKSYQDHFSSKKEETKEATSSGGAGQYDSLFSGEMSEMPKPTNKNSRSKNPERKTERHSEDDQEGYTKKIEAKEATSSASSGQYSTNKIWAKSTNKKDFRGYSKPQLPGGKFVRVKKKCKKFPYCNQGDINALNIFENETVHKVIHKISVERNIHKDIIYDILEEEINKLNKQSIYK